MEDKTLTKGTPWRVILSFMFPVFMGLLLQQLYNTVDTIVVGNFAGFACAIRAAMSAAIASSMR